MGLWRLFLIALGLAKKKVRRARALQRLGRGFIIFDSVSFLVVRVSSLLANITRRHARASATDCGVHAPGAGIEGGDVALETVRAEGKENHGAG